MALKKPAFEQEPTAQAQGDTATMEAPAQAAAPAVKTEAPAQAQTPTLESAVAAEVAISRASATALSVADSANAAKQFQREVAEMKGASDFGYGNYDVFKGGNGEIACTDTKASFGRWVKVRLMSWDDHVEISPGESGASTKDFVAYSKDGKVIDSIIGSEMKHWVGKTVAEYVTYLKETEEFTKTKSRRFIDTACAVFASDSGDGPIGEIVQITLSESSIGAFSSYQEKLIGKARAVAMGLPGFSLPSDPFTFYFVREVATKGDNRWTKLRIESNLPTKL